LHDALRAELLPYAVSVSVVEPGTVATRVMSSAKERGHFQDKADAANARGSELSATYSWFYDSPEAEGGAAFSEKFAQPPPIVTRAVMHALTAARPQTRYAVGNVMGVPAWLAVAVVRVLPDRLRDRLAMAPFNTNWFNATHPAATH
jgi:NAD(P)-dependent dehydrogenase (short-subunit alcohol dehydrogenase family)